ncbi:hypothetical protein EIN_502040 [Entamoeba invadens IP1]|uniref:Uncharacterized protein n=1 Tax=Entamoeba invadens IP1 TaxID=370355 RepID=A0A0A1TX87_ENTIV|nr:hypothetical protein EIN_502040 [Entamoeba invadens IP1]ELP84091.1 hypothetical protein EIN_502040 [Entamoeba invadens IP1]|eukprot:XP_004183437.1 hypothetical protein EIN_502040 [Entamoeba invadens IP1]
MAKASQIVADSTKQSRDLTGERLTRAFERIFSGTEEVATCKNIQSSFNRSGLVCRYIAGESKMFVDLSSASDFVAVYPDTFERVKCNQVLFRQLSAPDNTSERVTLIQTPRRQFNAALLFSEIEEKLFDLSNVGIDVQAVVYSLNLLKEVNLGRESVFPILKYTMNITNKDKTKTPKPKSAFTKQKVETTNKKRTNGTKPKVAK